MWGSFAPAYVIYLTIQHVGQLCPCLLHLTCAVGVFLWALSQIACWVLCSVLAETVSVVDGVVPIATVVGAAPIAAPAAPAAAAAAAAAPAANAAAAAAVVAVVVVAAVAAVAVVDAAAAADGAVVVVVVAAAVVAAAELREPLALSKHSTESRLLSFSAALLPC